MSDPGEIEHLTDVQRELNLAHRAMRAHAEEMLAYFRGGPPPPPPPWHRRARRRVQRFVRRDRERLARLIAPWLDEDW